ncbi:protein FAR1-RELATED SEQUENCE 5-like isoform X1 [Actinidia eriantha]|uniref:protein FAR1-RELATED SEQUENCE 5-like isoform X1 n=2 Tax=Actinidia eriantha TaxID=165200 RepID=UPI0025857159|nr:protein FAR1-RELATED SEQUENCE 5-like isoform X1 [Actinidia eriantha]XP_057464728.1 protein FAR1-RELATED SEQUENCE 5-like isoform X1 [Actinidia eriantha]
MSCCRLRTKPLTKQIMLSMAGSETGTLSHSVEEEADDISQTSTGLDFDVDLECQSLKVSAADKSGFETVGEKICPSTEVFSVDENREGIDNEQVYQSSKSSVVRSGMDKDGEHKCQSPEVSSVDKHGMDARGDQKGQNSRDSLMDNHGMDIDSKLEYHSPDEQLADVSGSGYFSGNDEAETYVVPELGAEFDSEDHAYRCYNRYAALEGFSIRKDFVNKSRANGYVVSRRYTCYKEGYRRTKADTNVKRPREDTRTGCLAHMTISRQPNGKYRVIHFETKHNHEFATPFTAHMLPSQRRTTFAEAVESEFANSVIDGVPKLGMGFDSEDVAYEFYNAYAGQVGFSVRKDYVNKSKKDGAVASRRFTCFREGFRQKDRRDSNVKRPRKETRIGCSAQLVIARQADGKYRITRFEEKHNHELVPFCRVRMLRSQKKSAAVEAAEATPICSSGVQPNSTSDLIFKAVADREGLRCHPIDYESNLPEKRMRDMKQGESESILQYLQNKQLKDPSFFYAVQLDAEGQTTNFFWADVKMLEDYGDFGDVVCFDTTYRLNKDYRPFAPFIGVNHHKQMVVFGAALLYDETVKSFLWLFQKFLEAMSGKKPKTILTDQDAIMAEAINSVLPEAHHRLCAWHVYQKALKYLSETIVGLDSFASNFSSCVFSHDKEQDFVDAWKDMLDVYGLWENEWLQDIFKEREKWAIPYGRHIFCADIKGAQLSQSFSTNLRKYLKSDLDVLQLFKQFGKVVSDWRYKEIEANYDMSQRMPRLMGDVILLKHARDLYTPTIFELFQQEYENSLNAVVNQCTESQSLSEYKVNIYGQVLEHTVVFNSSEDSVVCSCMKFQFFGILCSHALKVLDYRNIKVVPTRYILKRWTKDARV